MANIDKLKAVLAKIEADPTQWDQGTWLKKTACGTAGCLAGWTVLMEGAVAHNLTPLGYMNIETATECELDGAVHNVGEAAAEILELTEDEADELFDSENSIDDLRTLVAGLVNGNFWEAADEVNDARYSR